MTSQINNLVVSFNEILLHTGNLLDELLTDKSSNLLLPNNNRPSSKLNNAIKTFDSNLDRVLIQLNEISLFDAKLKQREVERAQEQKPLASQIKPEPQQQINFQQTDVEIPIDEFSNGDNLLNDISDFLSTVPDASDVNLNGDYDNIMVNSGDYTQNTDYMQQGFDNNMDIDINGFNENGIINQNDNIGGDLDIDSNLFGEIDSMLNI